MSEYQYYEFRAIDRPLTDSEMRELRKYSTRANITPVSFVNHYNWGGFKGDEDAWMERYFDAFLYYANWGTRILMFRLPSKLLSLELAREYCPCDSSKAREKAGKVILTFMSDDDESGDDWGIEDESGLAAFLPIRDEIARGDMRALYLAWLLCAQNGETGDDDEEPPVPPNLGELSASQRSLVEFLRIDQYLLAAASQASSKTAAKPFDKAGLLKWVGALSANEKDKMLVDLMLGENRHIGNELMARFNLEQRRPPKPGTLRRRTVAELLQAAEEHRQAADRKAAEEKARRKQEAIAAREKYLDTLAGREQEMWTNIEKLIATTKPKSYEEALKILSDLRDLAARRKDRDFQQRVLAMRAAHARKPSFIRMLQNAGLTLSQQ